ncbi:MAG: 2-oxoglutarate dehydrogenase E1 component [Verrucomicrobiota bacterium]|nr:2-oxoglutarate dehydrogenase E1 component [Verrucomicrobiota bacterium]
MPPPLDFAHFGNLRFIVEEELRYRRDPLSVDPSWRHFFDEMKPAEGAKALQALLLIDAYRRLGHLAARTNPLLPPENIPELSCSHWGLSGGEIVPCFGVLGKEKCSVAELVGSLRLLYAEEQGFECAGIVEPRIEEWMRSRIEGERLRKCTVEEKREILKQLNASELLETFLHKRYVGQTRFSLEGNETLIPLLQELIEKGAEQGIEEVWIGMAHRGRLNVLANILKQPLREIFTSFEDDLSLSLFESDDVKYHLGFSSEVVTKSGKKIFVSLPPNPSHLESLDPILLGSVRGRRGKKVLPIMIHGDAALAGQGVVYEMLQFNHLPGYEVGGTVHVVLNNQIGYTTLPKEGRSTRYCTDIAKAFGMPVVHLNAEMPESAFEIVEMVLEFRKTFASDLFIDLIGYRKYGHNEGDDPSFTQPLEYRGIRSRKPIRTLYLEKLLAEKVLTQEEAAAMESEFQRALEEAIVKEKPSSLPLEIAGEVAEEDVETKIGLEIFEKIRSTFCEVPAAFHPHPKLMPWLQKRRTEERIDWAWAEALSFGSLLVEGHRIRLAGEDVQRGTFSQRHLVWTDYETGKFYSPLSRLERESGSLELVNSPLTEYAGMGFEYGYSCTDPHTLTLWEAQYGDFVNGAQVIIDQYLVSAKQKWGTRSSLTLLLPHAYEGAGPEHSSARLERFLQLAAMDNISVALPSTPAQYFHLLRRQMLRKEKRPLVILTPKSLLRHPLCTSHITALTEGRFQPLLSDPLAIASPRRLILCSGKVFYDLIGARKVGSDTRIVRIEELYPFPIQEIEKQIAAAEGASFFWVQEEPENMGAWRWVAPQLAKWGSWRYIGRSANATPATGSHRKHKEEQAALVKQALEI